MPTLSDYIKRIFYLWAFPILFLIISSGKSSAQPGMPIVEYYGTEEYSAGIQNYAITQDFRGIIYVANNFGLLEFDGSAWRNYETGKGTKVRSVYSDSKGRVFIGAQNEIGYFSPSENGSYEYHSLNSLIPEEFRNFNEIWDIYPNKDGLVFTGSTELLFYHYSNNTIEGLSISNSTDFSFNLRGKLYTGFWDGIKSFEEESWKTPPFSGILKDMQTTGMIPYGKEHTLLSTFDHGTFLIDGNGGVFNWATKYQNIFKEHKINEILRLKNGSIAIGTNTDGLYILDPKGELIFHFIKHKGITNRTIVALYEDTFGNIWIGLNNGIAKIEWQSPFSMVNEEMGLQGTGYVAYKKDDYTYFGTDNGLFYVHGEGIPSSRLTNKVPGINEQIYDIRDVNGDLLVASHKGAYQLSEANIHQISTRNGWWTFTKTSNPKLAIAGTYTGLILLRKEGEYWTIEKEYEGFTESSRVMEFDESERLWMTHGYKGVYSFTFSDDFQEIEQQKFYGSEDGFPSNLLINVYKINQELIFAAERGVYSYDATSDLFVPHAKYNNIFGPQAHIRALSEDSFGNLYFIDTERSGKLTRSSWGEFELETNMFQKIHQSLNNDLENISIIDDENILFASKDGFIHYQSNGTTGVNYEINLLIRKVMVSENDSTVFGGNFYDNNIVLINQPESAVLELPYRFNSIIITYSGIDYNQGDATYRFMLDGFNKNWSEWTSRTEKEYTNLHEGTYLFKVEAKDVYGNLSSTQEYLFKILPPWYRTWIAYLGYLLLSILIFITSVILGQRKVKREKNRIIDKQKEEIEDLEIVSQSSKEEIQKLRTEKLKNEIKHKNKELATNAMHLIDKNSFIGSIKTNLSEIIKNENDSKNKQSLNRIIKNIERNIDSDNDWAQFEVHFDEVHEEFLKKLRTDHPQITPQEVKLSAYLRMNMSTKEIANLLRISVRGVEIGRYRLRKKLDLPKDANLVDYMMNY
jgi:ligand-binding sensor domain-containing protein/DNA-binding CsgD family transcriptional regulator